MIHSSPFFPQQLKIKTHILVHSLTYSSTLQTTFTLFFLHLVTMPGPDPRKTKPSAYTIPKAGSSKVGTRPPLHSGTSSAANKDDNPRPLSHQEVRRSKNKQPPVVQRHSARMPGSKRSPDPALRSRVASLKRPTKYDPKSVSNLTKLSS